MSSVLFLSLFRPHIHNIGGPTRLVHDILSALPSGENVDLLIVDEEELETGIVGVKSVSWSTLARRRRRSDLVPFLVSKAFSRLRSTEVDLSRYGDVVVYPYQLAALVPQSYLGRVHIIGMDSASLLFGRALLNAGTLPLRVGSLIRLLQNLRLESRLGKKAASVTVVGRSDANFYRDLLGVDATYIPHPVTDLVAGRTRAFWHPDRPLRVCIAGAVDPLYVGRFLDRLVDDLAQIWPLEKTCLEFHLLGPSLRSYADRLERIGFSVFHTKFVDSYEDYVAGCDLFLAPLAVGAGTKNRVLTAFGLGLDVIGTSIALENVHGHQGHHIANTPTSMLEALADRIRDGRLFGLGPGALEEFMVHHSKENWSRKFWKSHVLNR